MTKRPGLLKLHPAALVLGSFLLIIALGTSLLLLPAAQTEGGLTFIDALFTATSAVCVTGLTVVDTGGTFTHFGHLVLLALIQVGGLGLMTISVAFFQWIGKNVSYRQRMAMQDLFAHTPRQDIYRVVQSIILFTLAAEAVGAGLLLVRFLEEMPPGQAAFWAAFHSVSAFCNAGFALRPDNLMGYGGDVLVNLTICGLIVVGGIGFPVLYDLQRRVLAPEGTRTRLSLQTKIVLSTTLILILAGALLIGLLEHRSLAQAPSDAHRLLKPLFQSITCRTAGFNTMDIGALQDATLGVMIFLMFFGASPGSCGGGVKTTTLALLAGFTLSRLKRRLRVNMFKKSLPKQTVTRSMSLVLVSMGVVCVVLFMLLAEEAAHPLPAGAVPRSFLAYLFETVSAFGTVGLSMNLTPLLSTWAKSWITLTMIIGRVGVLAFAYILMGAGAPGGVEYSKENVMVG